MHERITEAIQDRAIELELGTVQLDLHPLATERSATSRAMTRQGIENAQQRRGAQVEGAALELAHHAIHAVEPLGQVRRLAGLVDLRRRCAPDSC